MTAASGIRAGRAYVELYADHSKLTRGLKQAQGQLNAFGNQVTAIGSKLLAASAAAGSMFLLGGREYATFEEQMARVATMLDDPAAHLEHFTQRIGELSEEFGESTETLAGGLYDILSASIPAEQALDVLEVSARAAKAGITSTAIAADAITTILNAYGLSADKAGAVSDWLFTIVRRGKTTFAELAPQIGMVASIASVSGLSLQELGAGLALLTRNGVQTDNAITALRAVVNTFLKPAAEAVDLARELGFELSSTTLRTLGLEGVLQRISQLPPDAIAQLFPNVRALTGVLSALGHLEEFSGDIAAMDNSAGATETAFATMTNTISHGFNQMYQAGKRLLTVIGSALADEIRIVMLNARALIGHIRQWITENQELVVTIARVVAIVGIIGGVLVTIGTAAKMAAFSLGIVADSAKLVGTVFKLSLVSIKILLTSLLSPLGLVIAGVAALATAILYYSGLGGQALDWLKARFSVLVEDAGTAIEAISAALRSGNISLAARILWLTLKMEWQRGINALQNFWISFKEDFVQVAVGAFYGIQAAWTIVVSTMQVAWIELVSLLQSAWAGFQNWHATQVETWANWFAKKMVWVQSLFDDSIDVEVAYRMIDEDSADRFNQIENQQQQRLDEIEANRQSRRNQQQADYEAEMARIGTDQMAMAENLRATFDEERAEIEGELAATRAQWQAAILEAHAETTESDESEQSSQLDQQIRGLQDLDITEAVRQANVVGTFNASAASGLGMGNMAQRTALAAEATAENTQRLIEEVRTGGSRFS